MSDYIKIKGARVHNLKNISINIPKNKLVVITGLSGSGKSSLAFDTIYAEAERRFVESLSSYARQFLGIREKPEIEKITGLSPAIAIDQKSVSRNPRSTVGTITEIYDYLRLLFAGLGKPVCPACRKPVEKQSVDQIIRQILSKAANKPITILAPLVVGRKGEHKKVMEEVQKSGFLRVMLDKEIMRTEEALDLKLDPKKTHSLHLVVDRLLIDKASPVGLRPKASPVGLRPKASPVGLRPKETERPRLAESLETALHYGKGFCNVAIGTPPPTRLSESPGLSESLVTFSENFACAKCGFSFPKIEPRLFSFNSPYGACRHCDGLGSVLEVDESLVLPNKNLTLAEGAIQPWARASHRVGRQSWYWWILEDIAERYRFSVDAPVKDLSPNIIKLILFGESAISSNLKSQISNLKTGNFEGVIPNLKRRWKETESDWTRAELERYMRFEKCRICSGARLREEALSVFIGGKNIAEIAGLSVGDALEFINKLSQTDGLKSRAGEKIISSLGKEISIRLQFLIDVGLDYITLERDSATLAGGEAQRVKIATQIGSGLSGVIYVLDEPSVGLHPRDHFRLIKTLKNLRDLGNTVIVVEHDALTMKEADWIIDLGPGAGEKGGRIIFEGTYNQLLKSNTLTGDYLSGRRKVECQSQALTTTSLSKPGFDVLKIIGAAEHNLKNIDVEIPLRKFVCVSGVSGSGKSTLVNDILGRTLQKHFYGSKEEPGQHKKILGIENLNKVALVDQSPIGRTPRSNPATYTGAFSFIRELFSKTLEARSRGYKPGRFSFNVKGGRCEVCEGQGVKKIEMYFLPDIFVECEECQGTRYNKEALNISYKGKNISEVLNMSVKQALIFFGSIPKIKIRLKTLAEVGLDYIKLGQSATTLSGGEAQRVKLATELAKKATGDTLYVLDEPTTGLHFDDILKLLKVLKALVFKGNSVLVIEHNLDVLKNADWLIDLGPEGGENGGKIVAQGSVKEIIAKKEVSHTGKWIQRSI